MPLAAVLALVVRHRPPGHENLTKLASESMEGRQNEEFGAHAPVPGSVVNCLLIISRHLQALLRSWAMVVPAPKS